MLGVIADFESHLKKQCQLAEITKAKADGKWAYANSQRVIGLITQNMAILVTADLLGIGGVASIY